MLDLAMRVIDRKKGKFDPSKLEDRYGQAVLELIKSTKKKGGRKAPAREAEDRPSNVINLFDALKKSLASGGNDNEPKTKREEPQKKPAPRKPPAKRKTAASRAKKTATQKTTGRKSSAKKRTSA
jgi:DNA end-binding protein Ku